MKNHHHNGPLESTSRDMVHEGIAVRAYEIWVGCGKPENLADAIWLEAERELMTGRNNPASNPALPVSF